MKFERENWPSEDTKFLPTEFASVGTPVGVTWNAGKSLEVPLGGGGGEKRRVIAMKAGKNESRPPPKKN